MLFPKYTEVLKNLMDNPQTMELINKAMSTYPMYEPTNKVCYTLIPTRSELNQKILNYYKYREIGFETVGRFLDELEISLNEIMPFYYQLYKSVDIMNSIEDPFGNVDIVESFKQTSTGNSNTSSTSEGSSSSEASSDSTAETDLNSNNKNVKSLTPNGQLDIVASNIDSVEYADEVNWQKDNNSTNGTNHDESSSSSNTKTSGTSTNESSGTVEHTFSKVGNQGVNTYAHDMKELREVFLNIEQMIIKNERISELFMRVY